MPLRIARRDFMLTGVAAAGLSATERSIAAQPQAAAKPRGSRPVVISSANGNKYKHTGNVTCVEKAFKMITEGADVLDALIAGVNLCELDPLDTSVGYGGLPNGEGVVQLDCCCMHGPKKRAGGVAALEGVRTPSLVAQMVMEQTDHHLLVGAGAKTFARQMGFKIEADLNTDTSRKLWLEWKRQIDPEHFLDPKKRAEAGFDAAKKMAQAGLIDLDHLYGTINCNGVGLKGEVCGVTTTSGLPWKIPGRVGDSPILGAGLYVDNEVGAAGSTGRGEANLYNLSSYLIVEELRRGKSPKDAGMDALKRIQKNTVEKRLLNKRGLPNFDVKFYVVTPQGEYAGVSMYPAKFALCDANGPRTLDTEALLAGKPED